MHWGTRAIHVKVATYHSEYCTHNTVTAPHTTQSHTQDSDSSTHKINSSTHKTNSSTHLCLAPHDEVEGAIHIFTPGVGRRIVHVELVLRSVQSHGQRSLGALWGAAFIRAHTPSEVVHELAVCEWVSGWVVAQCEGLYCTETSSDKQQ